MNIQEFILEAVSSVRMIFFTAVNMYVAILFIKSTLEKKRSYRFLIAYLLYRLFIFDWLYLQICGTFISSGTWMQILHMILYILNGVGMCAVCCYTFHGGWIKTGAVLVCADVAASLLGIGNLFLINWLEGKQNLFSVSGFLNVLDLLVLAFVFFEWKLIWKLTHGMCGKMKDYKLKHPVLWAIFWWAYLLLGFSTAQEYHVRDVIRTIHGVVVFFFILFVVVVYIAGYIYHLHQMEVVHRYKFLKKQQELIVLHSKNIQKQITQMEQSQRQIDMQMKKLLSEAGKEGFDERVQMYLNQLTSEYQSIKACMFCCDWMVDAVLMHMFQKFQKKNIPCNFLFQNYEPGKMTSEDMSEMILNLLSLNISSEVCLKAQNIGQDLFLEFSCPDIPCKRTVKRAVRRTVKKYEGEVWEEKGAFPYKYLIRIPKIT